MYICINSSLQGGATSYTYVCIQIATLKWARCTTDENKEKMNIHDEVLKDLYNYM